MSNPAFELLQGIFKVHTEEYPVPALEAIQPQVKAFQKEHTNRLKKILKAIKSGKLEDLEDASVNGQAGSKANLTSVSEDDSEELGATGSVTVKSEKLSAEGSEKENVEVKRDEMPAPLWIPPVKKKAIKTERASSTRTTRTKGKKVSAARDSDVIVQDTMVPLVNLTDDEEMPRATRSNRTKVKKEAATAKEDPEVETSRSTRAISRTATQEDAHTDTRPTRSKAVKKPQEEVQTLEKPPEEMRSTRTRTIRKAKNAEEAAAGDKAEAAAEETFTRSTRSKAVKKAVKPPINETFVAESQDTTSEDKVAMSKRQRSFADEDKQTKKSKSCSPHPAANSTTQTVYEDARSTMNVPNEPQANATFVLPTTDAEGDPFEIFAGKKADLDGRCDLDNMLTDDDSEPTGVKTPPAQAVPSIKKSAKEVFSPYEKTTTKKKVEAFEKLQHGSDIPVRAAVAKIVRDVNSAVKEKTKIFTPSRPNLLPSGGSTSKVNRFFGSQHSSSQDSGISASKFVGQSCQRDPRDLAKRQQEREQAIKKKEAILQYQAEQKRKRNEEKQQRAQQQRKALEEEKAKLLELQKKKEDKLKQRELEREENHQKFVQEQERKRQAQKKRFLEAQKEAEVKKPIYMTMRAPQLNPGDYDSDDPNYQEQPDTETPRWCKGDISRKMQMCMLAAGDKIKNTLFCTKPQTVNLEDIFENIEPHKLKRTSSAIWRQAPRYTMMPNLEDTVFSEDEDMFED